MEHLNRAAPKTTLDASLSHACSHGVQQLQQRLQHHLPGEERRASDDAAKPRCASGTQWALSYSEMCMPAGTPVINALAARHRLRCPGQLRALALRRLALDWLRLRHRVSGPQHTYYVPITCKRLSGHFLQGTTRTTQARPHASRLPTNGARIQGSSSPTDARMRRPGNTPGWEVLDGGPRLGWSRAGLQLSYHFTKDGSRDMV